MKIVNDNYLYAKTAKFIGNRKEFTEEKLDDLEEVVMDSGKARAIYDASRSSMGKMFTHYCPPPPQSGAKDMEMPDVRPSVCLSKICCKRSKIFIC